MTSPYDHPLDEKKEVDVSEGSMEESPRQKKPLLKKKVVVMHSPPPGGTFFHPDFMFCGECTECNSDPHPPAKESSLDSNTESFTAASSSSSSATIRTQVRLLHSWKSPDHALVLKSLVTPIAGVSNVAVHLEDSTITITHDAQCQDEQFLVVLRQGGYPATIAATEEATDLDRDEIMGRSKDEHVVRSSFFVQGICCASEVPSIRRIIKPLHGVSNLQINITTKRVYVQHDASLIGAKEIATELTKQGFPAQIVKNGAAAREQKATNRSVGRSTLHSKAVLHEQDIPKIRHKLEGLPGIQRIGVNVSESVIYVEHDVHVLKASELIDPLKSHYQATLVHDAEADIAQRTAALLEQPRSKYVESTIMVTNLTHGHVPVLQKAAKQNYIRAHVRALHPHVVSHTVKVEHNPDYVTVQAVCDTLAPYGLDAHVVSDGAVEKLYLPLVEEETVNEEQAAAAVEDWQTNNLQLHVILSGIFWVISMLSAVGGNWAYLEYAGLFSVFFGLPPVALKAWRTLRRCQFDANCMMVTAALGALALGEFDEAASVSFLFAVSEFLESRATNRARKALSEIVNLRPDHASVIHPVSKEIVVIPAEKVPVGSLISVRTGDKIAADGIVVEGTSSVDESSLTGESTPVRKTIDSTVSGGSINIGTTHLVVQTTSSVEDSAVSRLIRLVEEAQANRSPTEKMIDGFARAYTPAVVLLAAVMATIPWIFGSEVGRYWTLNALIIIVIACPCALTISTPVSYAAALAATAQRGIIVKGGASLEALGSVDKVILDKTGTLTEGNFTVTHLAEIGDKRSRKEMLSLLALMEAPSSHPLSATLVKAAKREGVSAPSNVELKEHKILKGEGVEATVKGKQVYVGNRHLFERLGMFEDLPQAYKDLSEEWNSKGGTVGFLGVEEEGIIGAFCMIDSVRNEAREVVESLLFNGFEVIMLTGDGDGAARTVAEQVGLPESAVHSQLLPEDKLHFVGSLKQPAPKRSCGVFRHQPKVLVCGDGVNDAPALAIADIGVSMGEGAALAMEMSDVTLMDSNLTKLLYVVKMGKRVMLTVQENIVLSLICKLAVVGLTFAGYMTLLYAIASDVGVMLLVTLNGMKLLPGNAEVRLSKVQRRKSTKIYDELPLAGSASPSNVAEIV